MKHLSLSVLLLLSIQASCVASHTTRSSVQAGLGCDDSMNGTLEALAPWMVGTVALGGLSYAATPDPSSAGGVGYDSYNEFFPALGLFVASGLGIWLTAELALSGVNALDCSDHLQAHGFDRPLTAEEIRAIEGKIRVVKPARKTESKRERRRREREERIAKSRSDKNHAQASKPWSERFVVPLDKLSVDQQALFEKVQGCDQIIVPEPDHNNAGFMMGAGAASALVGGITEGYVMMGSGLILAISGAFFYSSADSAYEKKIAQRKAECDATRSLWETELEILRAEQGLLPETNQGTESESEPSRNPTETEKNYKQKTEGDSLYNAPVNGPSDVVTGD